MLNNFPVKQGTASRRASSFNLGGHSAANEVVERPLESTGRAKLKYVQMEIAEKEACSLLKTLCQDASRHLHKKDPGYVENIEIQDLLTGILLLGNVSKRMAVAMNTMEETMIRVQEQHTAMKAEKEGFISQLESVILKLRDDKVQSDSALTEVQIKHDRLVTQLNKEIANLKEEQKEGHTEVHILKSKIASLERKVMEIPRMEERYLRTARGIVRQQEAANTVKEVEFKKIEEDVKSLQYWKNKAANLEEILLKQNNDVENYAIQARSALAKYQTLLNIYNTEKRTNKAFSGNVPAGVSLGGKEGGSGGRPGSAPPLRRATTIKVNDVTITSKGEFIVDDHKRGGGGGSGGEGDSELEDLIAQAEASKLANSGKRSNSAKKSATFSGVENKRPSSANKATKRRGLNVGEEEPEGGYRTLEQIQAIEIAKLKRQLAEKEDKLNKISRKLALARAYPLFNVTDEDDEKQTSSSSAKTAAAEVAPTVPGHVATVVGTNNKEKFGTYLNKPVQYDPKGSGKANIKAFFYQIDMEAENEQDTPEFIAREERLQNERFARAIALEQEYQDRILRTKEKNPPHIAAIRKSLSFAKTEET